MGVSFLEFIMLSLASFRLTRLVVFDKITEFLRDPFFNEVIEKDQDGNEEVYYMPKEQHPYKFFGELLSCYWCTGVWSAAGLVVFYYFVPTIAVPLILVFAVAGLAALFETVVQYWLNE